MVSSDCYNIIGDGTDVTGNLTLCLFMDPEGLAEDCEESYELLDCFEMSGDMTCESAKMDFDEEMAYYASYYEESGLSAMTWAEETSWVSEALENRDEFEAVCARSGLMVAAYGTLDEGYYGSGDDMWCVGSKTGDMYNGALCYWAADRKSY